MLIYILKRHGLVTINILLVKDTIRVIFYIWQRNNLLPIFLCGVLWGKMGECGEGIYREKEQFLPPFCQVKSRVFAILIQCQTQHNHLLCLAGESKTPRISPFKAPYSDETSSRV